MLNGTVKKNSFSYRNRKMKEKSDLFYGDLSKTISKNQLLCLSYAPFK
jgi:hypothetical protein